MESSYFDLSPDLFERVPYNFPDFNVYLAVDHLSHLPNYSVISHWHDAIELISVQSGKMDYVVNGDIIPLHPHEGLFVNSRQMHGGYSDVHKECVYSCVLYHPIHLCLTPRFEQNYITPVTQNQAFPYQKLQSAISWQKHILDMTDELCLHPDEKAEELKIQAVCTEIWRELYLHAPANEQQSYKLSGQLSCMKEMMYFIQNHFTEKLSLMQIAEAGNVCKSKCCAMFQRFLHQTPVAYLTDCRLQKSIELMKTTDMNITEIGFEVGFSGTSYFIETFHKYYGCSPLEYRSKYLRVSEQKKQEEVLV